MKLVEEIVSFSKAYLCGRQKPIRVIRDSIKIY